MSQHGHPICGFLGWAGALEVELGRRERDGTCQRAVANRFDLGHVKQKHLSSWRTVNCHVQA